MARHPVVHLELRTPDVVGARAFLTELLGWTTETVETAGQSYVVLGLGERIDGGIVETGTRRVAWLPYVEVTDIEQMTDEARLLGASLALPPREGPAGWRSILVIPCGAEIALWQPKR